MNRFCLALSLAALAAACDPAVTGEDVDAASLPDDALAPPMSLSASEAHPGDALTLVATGAAPGATVRFFYSVNGVGPGPRLTGFGNMNFNIRAPVTTFPGGMAVADATGTAVYEFILPPTAPIGFTVGVEAAVKLGNRSYQSAGQTVVVTAAPVCTEDAFEDNDSATNAQGIPLDTAIPAHLCSLDDDWFAAWLDAGDDATVDALFSHAEGDVDVHVLAPDGVSVIASGSGVMDNEHVAFRVATTGWHFFRATLYADNGVLPGNDYELVVRSGPPVTTFSSGTFTVGGTYYADLDLGRQLGDADAAQADFWYEQVTSTIRRLSPEGGATFAAMGTTEPGYATCAAAPLSTASLDASDPARGVLPVGTWICYRTADGRLGEARVVGYGAAPYNDLTLAFTTFDDPSAYTAANDGVFTVPGTYTFDFETEAITGYTATDDFWWQQMTATTRQLVPRNGAQVAAVSYETPGPLLCEGASFSTTPISGDDLAFGPLSPWHSFCVITAEGHRAGFRVLSIDSAQNNGLVIGETWWY